MTREKPPRTFFIPPNVRESAVYYLACHETNARRVANRQNAFKAHDEHKVTIGTDELHLPLELAEIDDTGVHEGIQYGAPPHYNLITWSVDRKLFRPQFFQLWKVTVQSSDALLIVQRAHAFFVQLAI